MRLEQRLEAAQQVRWPGSVALRRGGAPSRAAWPSSMAAQPVQHQRARRRAAFELVRHLGHHTRHGVGATRPPLRPAPGARRHRAPATRRASLGQRRHQPCVPGSKVKACTVPGGTLTSDLAASASALPSRCSVPLPLRSSSSWCSRSWRCGASSQSCSDERAAMVSQCITSGRLRGLAEQAVGCGSVCGDACSKCTSRPPDPAIAPRRRRRIWFELVTPPTRRQA